MALTNLHSQGFTFSTQACRRRHAIGEYPYVPERLEVGDGSTIAGLDEGEQSFQRLRCSSACRHDIEVHGVIACLEIATNLLV